MSLHWDPSFQRKLVWVFFYCQKGLATQLRTSIVLLWQEEGSEIASPTPDSIQPQLQSMWRRGGQGTGVCHINPHQVNFKCRFSSDMKTHFSHDGPNSDSSGQMTSLCICVASLKEVIKKGYNSEPENWRQNLNPVPYVFDLRQTTELQHPCL